MMIRFMILHGLAGFAGGAVLVGLLLLGDLGGLGRLVASQPDGWIGAAAFAVLMGLTWGGVQISFAIGLHCMNEEDAAPRGGRGARLAPVAVPVGGRSGR